MRVDTSGVYTGFASRTYQGTRRSTVSPRPEEYLEDDARLAISPAEIVEQRLRDLCADASVPLSSLRTLRPYKGRRLD